MKPFTPVIRIEDPGGITVWRDEDIASEVDAWMRDGKNRKKKTMRHNSPSLRTPWSASLGSGRQRPDQPTETGLWLELHVVQACNHRCPASQVLSQVLSPSLLHCYLCNTMCERDCGTAAKSGRSGGRQIWGSRKSISPTLRHRRYLLKCGSLWRHYQLQRAISTCSR